MKATMLRFLYPGTWQRGNRHHDQQRSQAELPAAWWGSSHLPAGLGGGGESGEGWEGISFTLVV